MKKNILLFAAIIITYFGFAQQPFAPIGAKWHYSSVSNVYTPADANYWLHVSEKDTTINSIPCKKIAKTLFTNSDDTLTYFNPDFTYTATDTVYCYNHLLHKFIPLYIFNVHSGDTLTYHIHFTPVFSQDSTFRVKVDSIDFVTIDTFSLKRIYTSPIDEFGFRGPYIERIGCTGYFLPIHFSENEGSLRCYSDNDISINFTSFSCDYKETVGINSVLQQSKIYTYPNPANSSLYIKNTIPVNFEITNIFGQTVLKSTLTENQPINISQLPNGIFFLQVQDLNSSYITSVKFSKK